MTAKECSMQNFEAMCAVLKQRNWNFQTDTSDASPVIQTAVRGEDLAMPLQIEFDVDRQIAILISPMPFDIPEKTRMECAVATSLLNHSLASGSFDYNFVGGRICFRLANMHDSTVLSEELYDKMLDIACITIDHFNDKLLAVAKGIMKLDDFAKSMHA